jgi:hypothetical protein
MIRLHACLQLNIHRLQKIHRSSTSY